MAGNVNVTVRHVGVIGDPFFRNMTITIQHESGQTFYSSLTKRGLPLRTYWTCEFKNVPEGNYIASSGGESTKRTITVRDNQTTEITL